MPTFEELLQDKTKYPDDQKVTMQDGIEVTVGQLRAGYARRSELDQGRQAVTRDREAVAQERAALQTEKEEAERYLTGLAKQVVEDARRAGQPVTSEDVDDDPRIRAVREELKAITGKLEHVAQHQKAQDDELAARDRARYAAEHRAVLAMLKKSDPELDTDGLVDYAMQYHVPYLHIAYRAYRHDYLLEQKVKEAREEADKGGYERGKLEARAPAIPPRKSAGPPSPEAPKTFEEAADAASRDPEILAAMEGLPGV